MNALHWTGRALRKLGTEILRRGGIQGTWIDVGAHHGETTLGYASHNPGLKIYAIEPNLRAAAKLIGRAPNYLVIPIAIAEKDGSADFHINEFEMASSLLPLHEAGARSWVGIEPHKVECSVTVPTLRLETLMGFLGIEKVDFLKIDAQGMDLAILRSAGARLSDITKIELEVEVAPLPLYSGAPSKDEVLRFLGEAGFTLVGVVKQTHGQEENLTFIRGH
jgi:FkbM family methyltransferase